MPPITGYRDYHMLSRLCHVSPRPGTMGDCCTSLSPIRTGMIWNHGTPEFCVKTSFFMLSEVNSSTEGRNILLAE